jgi:hypothetical protein
MTASSFWYRFRSIMSASRSDAINPVRESSSIALMSLLRVRSAGDEMPDAASTADVAAQFAGSAFCIAETSARSASERSPAKYASIRRASFTSDCACCCSKRQVLYSCCHAS